MLENLSDKEFENLFRKVSDSQEIEYNPEGWDAMRSMLLKEKRRRRFLWFAFGLIGLLLTSSAILFLSSDVNNQIVKTTNPDLELIDHPKHNDPISNTETSAIVNDKAESPNQTTEAGDIIKSGTSISPPLVKKNTHSPSDLDKKADSKEIVNAKSNQIVDAGSSKIPIHGSQSHSKGIDNQNTRQDISKSGTREVFELESLPTLTLEVISDSQNTERLFTTDFASTPIEKQKRRLPISIELGFSREWTSTRLSYLKKGDMRAAIKVDFPIMKKLSAGLGIEYYADRYYINAGEYSPPEGFWTYDVAPLSTYAKCKMLDIPIHLTFHFSGINNPGIFASIGATSINILEEKYQYTYEKPNPHLIQEWSGTNTGKAIFNNIRLAGGFKFHIKHQWFAMISPYVQIPLSGIGFGRVKLYTVGTTFSVRLQKK